MNHVTLILMVSVLFLIIDRAHWFLLIVDRTHWFLLIVYWTHWFFLILILILILIIHWTNWFPFIVAIHIIDWFPFIIYWVYWFPFIIYWVYWFPFIIYWVYWFAVISKRTNRFPIIIVKPNRLTIISKRTNRFPIVIIKPNRLTIIGRTRIVNRNKLFIRFLLSVLFTNSVLAFLKTRFERTFASIAFRIILFEVTLRHVKFNSRWWFFICLFSSILKIHVYFSNKLILMLIVFKLYLIVDHKLQILLLLFFRKFTKNYCFHFLIHHS